MFYRPFKSLGDYICSYALQVACCPDYLLSADVRPLWKFVIPCMVVIWGCLDLGFNNEMRDCRVFFGRNSFVNRLGFVRICW